MSSDPDSTDTHPGTSMPHILVVDDDTRLRQLLKKFLLDQGFIVSTAEDVGDARVRMEGLTFDLLVLDVMMPGESGLDLIRSLRESGNTVPILLLTARSEIDDRIAGLETGADDYLPKPFEPRELVLRLRAILRRMPAAPDPPRTVRLGRWSYRPGDRALRDGQETRHLTEAEAALLGVLVQAVGTTLSRETLTERAAINGSARTVDVQVTRLRRKIELDPRRPRFLHTVRGEGYLLRVD